MWAVGKLANMVRRQDILVSAPSGKRMKVIHTEEDCECEACEACEEETSETSQ
jgi:hypothetical protein